MRINPVKIISGAKAETRKIISVDGFNKMMHFCLISAHQSVLKYLIFRLHNFSQDVLTGWMMEHVLLHPLQKPV